MRWCKGSSSGKLASKTIIGILYGDKKICELNEDGKQIVNVLSQLATDFAAPSTGSNFGYASAAICSSKNAVENNYREYMGYTLHKVAKTKCGNGPECIDKASVEIVQKYRKFMNEWYIIL